MSIPTPWGELLRVESVDWRAGGLARELCVWGGDDASLLRWLGEVGGETHLTAPVPAAPLGSRRSVGDSASLVIFCRLWLLVPLGDEDEDVACDGGLEEEEEEEAGVCAVFGGNEDGAADEGGLLG